MKRKVLFINKTRINAYSILFVFLFWSYWPAHALPSEDYEVRLIYFCSSLSPFMKDNETVGVLSEFLRREREMLTARGKVIFIGREESVNTQDQAITDFILQFRDKTQLDALFSLAPEPKEKQIKEKKKGRHNQKSKKNKKMANSLAFYYATDKNGLTLEVKELRFYFGRSYNADLSGYLQFQMQQSEKVSAERIWYFVNDDKLPQYGINDNYYLNCNLPYGSVGRLKLFFRNNSLIRQSADTVQLNKKHTSNSWMVP